MQPLLSSSTMFHQAGGIIREGDAVIFSLGCFKLLKTTMRHGAVTQTKYGAIRHNDLIDKLPYGSKYNCAHGYVHGLSPTPEHWTASLLHRTQIIYTPDVSLIIFNLDMRPGSKVIEAGTGSGSLSHAIIRTIAPSGHLYTFDFHEQRCRLAEAEFREHNYSKDLVTCHYRDVCSEGFLVKEGADNNFKVDAVFLDLPSPWKAIEFAMKKLVLGGKIAIFSPCIEQIQQTATTMREKGFANVRVLECIQQRYTVKELRAFEVPLTRVAYDHSRQFSSMPSLGKNRKQKAEEQEDEGSENENESQEQDQGVKGEATATTALSAQNSNSVSSGVFPLSPTPGHTGYLLFGTLFHSNSAEKKDEEIASSSSVSTPKL